MNAIVPMEFTEVERLAQSVARSKLFGIQTPEQAIVLMMISQAEGRHPALAARDWDIIQGKPAKKAEAMQRDFLEAGGRIEWHTLSDEIADATFSHPQGGTVRITWDHKRAVAAGIGGKDMWKKYPRQMLRSRTVSEGVRTVWPMATSGCYVPEEVRDFTGTTIEAEPVLTTAQAIQDELPPELQGDYPFFTKQGGHRIATAAEWQERWGKLIENYQKADALDRLQAVVDLNQSAITAVDAFDPKAAAIVRIAITTALPKAAPEDAWPDADAANEPENAAA